MSKIQIESNSQQAAGIVQNTFSCVYHVKDTNRKQFTTTHGRRNRSSWLCLSCQRYKSKAIHNMRALFPAQLSVVFIMSKIQIESNSQHLSDNFVISICCVYHVKDTNRKQFTTFCREAWNDNRLCLSCQRYKSKAIHNIRSVSIAKILLCLSCQRYKSKAIHNRRGKYHFVSLVVFIMSKIQIESNSQHLVVIKIFFKCCVYHVKDTNRKQFTT